MHRSFRASCFAVVIFGISAVSAADKPVVVKLDKLSAEAPAEWTAEKTSNRLRSFQFKLKGADGAMDGEIAVMPEQPPDPEKNFTRYKTSFIVPDGQTVDDVCKQYKENIKGATVHFLDCHGTWKFKERPFDPKSKEEERENYRVVWALVVEKDEATLVRISGPQTTMEKYFPGFEKWLKALK
jgi:hypothetical protein